MKKALGFEHSEIILKAMFLEHKYSSLLKEITAQKKAFGNPLAYWTTFHKIAQYQIVCQRIITNHFPKD